MTTATGAPRLVSPSLNCTVPTAFAGVTTALTVMLSPTSAAFGAEIVVVVSAETSTVWTPEVELWNPGPALYAAVMSWAPTLSKVWERVALPPETGTGEPMSLPPSLNWTVPLASDGATVAVRSTGVPTFAVAGATSVVPVATDGSTTWTLTLMGLRPCCVLKALTSKSMPLSYVPNAVPTGTV